MHQEGLAPGTVIASKYVVERPLGRGGMGAVYVVSHAGTGKRLAMKTLLSEFVSNADLVGRFLREAQVMGRLQHRHVVDVFDVGRDGDVLYIVMELLDGKPLSELLHDSSLTLAEALVILLRAMEGVSAAHAQGIVHRDLKPDNIFICVGTSGRLDDPRVLDFGISKLEDPSVDQLTRSGVSMGTPYYMSIEQLKGQRDLDQRVDVYALGVILYEAIAGDPPFVADSISALAIKVLTSHPVHLGRLRPDLPPGLADVVMKALARERDDRYRSVRQLIEALRPFVPRSAGLSVPEGQNRLLRTPRGANAALLRSGGSLPPVHARGTEGQLDSAGNETYPGVTRPRPRGARRLVWAASILALAGGAAVFSLRMGADGSGRSTTTDAPPGSSSPPGAPSATALDPANNPPQTPTHVAPTGSAGQGGADDALPTPTVASQPGALKTATGQAASALPGTSSGAADTGAASAQAKQGAAPDSARPQTAAQHTADPTEQALTPDSPLGGAIPRGVSAPSAGRAATAHSRSSRHRAHSTASVASEPSVQQPKPVELPAAPAASVVAPSTPRASNTSTAPSKSAEGRAGKLGSDEF